MARSGRVTVPPETVTELTNADVTGIMSFFNQGLEVKVLGTVDDTQPAVADFDDGYIYKLWQGERGVTLAELFPGAGFVRLWGYASIGTNVAVYHG